MLSVADSSSTLLISTKTTRKRNAYGDVTVSTGYGSGFNLRVEGLFVSYVKGNSHKTKVNTTGITRTATLRSRKATVRVAQEYTVRLAA